MSVASSDAYWLSPESIIEMTIGLWDGREIPLARRPTVMAADIMGALTRAGYVVGDRPLCQCDKQLLPHRHVRGCV